MYEISKATIYSCTCEGHLKVKPATLDSYKLLHNGAIALAQVEDNGIRIDVDYLQRTIIEIGSQIKGMEKELRQDPIYVLWRKRFGVNANLGSREQLGVILFDTMGHKSSEEKTATGRNKVDEAALDSVDLPFVLTYIKMQKLVKAKSTYLEGILRETVDGFMHPSFNLHTVQTYRSSGTDPNFQNMPIRNKTIGKMIRSAFIAREGHRIIECDYSGIEVRAAAFYHKDPTMMSYICDKSKDLHRDMAAVCYKMDVDQVTKESRYVAKNMYVFPQFYGSYYAKCAPAMWQAIDRMGLKTVNGQNLKVHLAKKGIKELGPCDSKQKPRPGTFEYHIQSVENDFWQNRFPVYAKWKEEWYDKYRKTGGISMLTGFRVEGLFGKNDIINYPVQGVAFHCLLASLTLLQKKLKRLKMKTLLIGQIHDSIIADVPEQETQEFCHMARETMTEDIPKLWDFVNVPLEVEIECSPVNGSWYEKAEWVCKGTKWRPKEKKVEVA